MKKAIVITLGVIIGVTGVLAICAHLADAAKLALYTSARTSPSELRIKQSCLSLATSIPTQTMRIPPMCLFDADSTELFTLVALFHINRLAVFN